MPNMKVVLFDADGNPLVVEREQTGRTVEITRSFSFKLNQQFYGGNQYESADFFCAQKVFCDEGEAEDASRAAYEFSRSQVLESVRHHIEAMRMKRLPKGQTA